MVKKAVQPLIGAHVSAAGGVSNAPINAHNEACETFQFFVSSPQSYKMNETTDEEVKRFKNNCTTYGYTDYFVHASYLINLASPNNRVRYGSITLLRKGLEACSRLGVQGMMFHTGSAAGQKDKATGLKKAEESIKKVLDGYTGETKLLIENAAGAGSTLGVTFEEVSQLFNAVKKSKHAGVCLDTQHAFASGYDWTDAAATNRALKRFDKLIGMEHLLVVQANDSKHPCGSNKDRHEHIGKGLIGTEGFRTLLHHSLLRNKPFILETQPDGRVEDIALLKKLRTQP